MAFTKLGVINDCLVLTGENSVNVENDGSPEWRVCSAAYDQAVPEFLEQHDWKFATAIATLSRVGASPDKDFDDAYAKPANCLHVIWVRVNDLPPRPKQGSPAEWKVVADQILLNASGGTLVVKCKYVQNVGESTFRSMFVAGVKWIVKSGIYRGLRRDEREAGMCEQKAEAAFQRASTRSDQEEPKRTLFRGNLRLQRRGRRA